MSRKQKTSRTDAAPTGGEDPREAADGQSPLQAAERSEEAVETARPVEAAEAAPSAQTATPSSPAAPSATARRAQALIDASKASGFPPPPSARRALKNS